LPCHSVVRPRREDLLQRAIDVVGDVEVEVAVAVGVEERGPGPPSRVGDAGPLGHLLEGPVAAVAVEPVRAELGDEEVDMAVVIIVGGADAAPPAVVADAGPLGRVLEPPAAAVAVQRVAAPLADPRRLLVEGPGVDQVDVQPAVLVVVDERRAGADRLEDVVLGDAPAPEHGGQSGLRGRVDEPRGRVGGGGADGAGEAATATGDGGGADGRSHAADPRASSRGREAVTKTHGMSHF
jgi:hypothetical protein